MVAVPPRASLDDVLQRVFGHRAFRTGQRELIESTLAGVPTLGIMPTGAGKSLAFQLPALLVPGMTLVVSPLVALMKDQVDALRARGLSAAAVHSLQSETEQRLTLDRARRGELKLLYAAPERFRSERFWSALSLRSIELLAIDEAHCISQWGHDFRPDYARLGEVRERLAPKRTVALTATATPEVRDDVVRELRLVSPRIFISGFDRPNLRFEVIDLVAHPGRLAPLVALARRGGSGLVYAATRRRAERLADELHAEGFPVATYHAGLDAQARIRAHEAWMTGGARVMVATNAFGMGVDKPDVRFVVHAQIPKAVEAYYQEAGRAGRDGRPATALLLFHPSDVSVQERLLSSTTPTPVMVRHLWDLLRFSALERRTPDELAQALGTGAGEVDAALKLLEKAGHLERGVRGDGPAEIALREPMATRPGNPGLVLESLRRRLGLQSEPVYLEELVGSTGLAPLAVRRCLVQLQREGVIAYRPPAPQRAVAIRTPGLPIERLAVDFAAEAARARQGRLLLHHMEQYARTPGCRRAYLRRYFGETAPERCGDCDHCVTPVDESAVTSRLLVEGGMSMADVARLRGMTLDEVRRQVVASPVVAARRAGAR